MDFTVDDRENSLVGFPLVLETSRAKLFEAARCGLCFWSSGG